MYLYFNSHGELKEVINNDFFRQTSTRNKIYIYVEGTVATSCSVKYRIPSGVLPLFYPSLVVTGMKIPYNPEQDLKYFNYKDEFNFIEIPITFTANGTQYNALSEAGTVTLTVRINGQALGLVVFNVEESSDGNNIQYDQYISLAQFYYLLELIENIGGGGGGSTGNYVTLDTEQTIDAKKYFRFLDAFLNTFHLRAGDNESADRFTFGYTQNGELKKALQIFSEVYNGISGFGVNFNWKFPYKSGTVALLDDMPEVPQNIVTTNTNQDDITGNKTFKGDIVIDSNGSLKVYKTPADSQDAVNKGYVDGLITGSVHFKGTVADMTALNAVQNPIQGDEYWVTSENKYYIWNGTVWSAAGGGVDLSDYSTTVQMNAAIAAAQCYVITKSDSSQFTAQQVSDLASNKAVVKYNGDIYFPSFEDTDNLELRTVINGGQKRILIGKAAGSWSDRTEWYRCIYSTDEFDLSDDISSVWLNTLITSDTSNRLCYFTIKDTNTPGYNGGYLAVISGSAPNYAWIITDLTRGLTYSGSGAQTFGNIFSNTYRIINPYELPGYVFSESESIQNLVDEFTGKLIIFKVSQTGKMYTFTANATSYYITDLEKGDVYSGTNDYASSRTLGGVIGGYAYWINGQPYKWISFNGGYTLTSADVDKLSSGKYAISEPYGGNNERKYYLADKSDSELKYVCCKDNYIHTITIDRLNVTWTYSVIAAGIPSTSGVAKGKGLTVDSSNVAVWDYPFSNGLRAVPIPTGAYANNKLSDIGDILGHSNIGQILYNNKYYLMRVSGPGPWSFWLYDIADNIEYSGVTGATDSHLPDLISDTYKKDIIADSLRRELVQSSNTLETLASKHPGYFLGIYDSNLYLMEIKANSSVSGNYSFRIIGLSDGSEYLTSSPTGIANTTINNVIAGPSSAYYRQATEKLRIIEVTSSTTIEEVRTSLQDDTLGMIKYSGVNEYSYFLAKIRYSNPFYFVKVISCTNQLDGWDFSTTDGTLPLIGRLDTGTRSKNAFPLYYVADSITLSDLYSKFGATTYILHINGYESGFYLCSLTTQGSSVYGLYLRKLNSMTEYYSGSQLSANLSLRNFIGGGGIAVNYLAKASTKLYKHTLGGFTVYQSSTLVIVNNSSTPITTIAGIVESDSIYCYVTGGGVNSRKDKVAQLGYTGNLLGVTLAELAFNSSTNQYSSSLEVVTEDLTGVTITDTVTDY